MLPSTIALPESLLPTDNSFPYYIVTPPYTSTSAGIAALHVLSHWLNMCGFNAYLYFIPRENGLAINPRMQTPILDVNIVSHHFRAGLTPIVLYPEVISGNPFAATVRARWIGNYPGLLGGSETFHQDELSFAHSEHLARLAGQRTNILCIPVVDTTIFKPLADGPRRGACFYARKFQDVHGQEVFGLPANSIEITRSFPATKIELAKLFRRSEVFYCFEDSALINEAALCGCPAVMMKNAYFEWPLGIEEVGWDGYAWGDSASEIERAKSTVTLAYDNYVRNIPRFFYQLHNFVLLTQQRARHTPYLRQVILPGENTLVDERQELKSRLADAILEIKALKSASTQDHIIWTPDLTISGATSPVTFIFGLDNITPSGARAERHLEFSICPGDAVAIELVLALDQNALSIEDYALVYDFDVHRQFTLVPGQVLKISLAVLVPGQPIYVAIRQLDPHRVGALMLTMIKAAEKGDELQLKNFLPRSSVCKQFMLDGRAISYLQALDCTVEHNDDNLEIDASSPDPHFIVDVSRGANTTLMPVFVWGAYDIGRDEALQIYMPASESGTYVESLSCKVALKRGRHVFVTRLPTSEFCGPIRIDPIEMPGHISFSAFSFVFGQPNRRSIYKSEVPVSPRLDRFERHSLLDGTAFPHPERCRVSYAHNAVEIRTIGEEAIIVFYLVEPFRFIEPKPAFVELSYESTLSGNVWIRFPDDSGLYTDASMTKNAKIMRGKHTAEFQVALCGSVQSMQITLNHVDILRVLALDVLFARE